MINKTKENLKAIFQIIVAIAPSDYLYHSVQNTKNKQKRSDNTLKYTRSVKHSKGSIIHHNHHTQDETKA